MTESLYERLGGFTRLHKVVSDFYDRVLDEPELSPFFAHTDMATLVDHQTKFFAFLLGGPASYTNEHLQKIHASMNIRSHHFDCVLEILRDTLDDWGLDPSDIEHVESELRSRKPFLVSGS